MVTNLINTEIEKVVLGAIIQEQSIYAQIADIFDLSLFTHPDYINLAKVIIRLKNEGKSVDMLVVGQEMKKSDYFNHAFGYYELSDINSKIGTTANTHQHVFLLKELAMKRKVIEVSQQSIRRAEAFNSDVFEVIDYAEQGITKITASIVSTNVETPEELHQKAILHNQRILDLKGSLSGITSGFRKIDDITGGWQNGTLNIIAGATSMGKSAISLDFLLASALSGNPTAMFSLEVSNAKIYSRLQSKVSGIDLHKITKIGLDATEMRTMNMSCQALQRARLYFDDISGLNIFQFRNKARSLKRKFGIKMIIIDYLQLMGGKDKGNREQEIASISRGLKEISKELDLPIICLSQLSRKIEDRADKEPKLSDLRESGAIEQDADIVSFIFRPEYYGITVDDLGNSLIGKAKFFIKKNREGELGEVKLDYIGRLTKFQSEDIGEYKPMSLQPNENWEKQTGIIS